MKDDITRDDARERGRLWPAALGLIGALNLADYFYRLSFQPDDLLQGVGFLLVVPLAYLHPAAFADPFRARGSPAGSAWSRRLARVGILLAIAGFVVEWL